MSTEGKSLGQIAHESRHAWYSGKTKVVQIIPWHMLPEWQRREFEEMAQAVKRAVLAEKT